MPSLISGLACAWCALCPASRGWCQSASGDTAAVVAPPSHPAYEIWIGVAGGSPNLGVLGSTPGQRFAVAAFRVRRPAKETALARLDYTVDYIPIALTSRPLAYPGGPPCGEALCPESGPLFGDGAAFGVGVSPLGGEVVFAPRARTHLSLGLAAGALVFHKPVPITSGTRFNLTAAATIGLAALTEKGRGWTIGYRFHHLSNAGLVSNNPGLASHLFFGGVRWR